MKITAIVAACTCTLAFALGYGTAHLGGTSDPGSSADRTMFSFVKAAKGQNFGRACSYMTQEWAANLNVCRKMDARVVPGSKRVVDEDTVTYLVDFGDGYPPSKVTVELQPNDKWRIVEVL